jgi:hypothetical protein
VGRGVTLDDALVILMFGALLAYIVIILTKD